MLRLRRAILLATTAIAFLLLMPMVVEGSSCQCTCSGNGAGSGSGTIGRESTIRGPCEAKGAECIGKCQGLPITTPNECTARGQTCCQYVGKRSGGTKRSSTPCTDMDGKCVKPPNDCGKAVGPHVNSGTECDHKNNEICCIGT